MKFSRNKKIILGILAVIILMAAETGVVHAGIGDLLGISSIAIKAVGWLGAGVGYIFGFLAGIVFSIGGALITLALGLNKELLSKGSIVLVGWPIVLNFANLGFVLAIIVIAFATIFRSQTYGMKQALWKLIVAALLVNFSLVIAGAFISVADITTEIFINQAIGEGAVDFSTRLAGLFRAQQFLQAGDAEAPETAIQGMSEFGGSLLTFLAQIIFGAGFTFLAALTLLAIAIMLLIRYIVLAILLILVPLVWLLWIFPATQEHWKKWWSEFIRWTFFAPIVSFFMMLAVTAIKNYPVYVDDIIKNTVDKQGNVGGVGGALFGGAGNLVVVMGLLLGGLYAANKMSITFASTAYGWAQSAGKKFGNLARRKSVALGTRPLRGAWGKKLTEGMQKAGLGRGRLGKLVAAPVRHLGTVVSGVGMQQGERLVKDAGERLDKRFINDRSLANAFSTLSRDEQIAAVKRFGKNKTMNLMNENDINRLIGAGGTKKFFERHGAGKDYDDFEKAAGRNTETVRALTAEEKETALEAHYKKYSPKDFEGIRTNAVLGGKDGDADIRFRAMVETNPGALAKIMPKLSSADFKTIVKSTMKTVMSPQEFYELDMVEEKDDDKFYKIARDHVGDEKKHNEKYKNLYKSLSKNLGNRLTGFIEVEKEEAEKESPKIGETKKT